ncbi:hypothetical protein BST25_13835 [Mycobacterium heidelbergense]|uniref:Uncharacterized protein n=2 Tax=Mycobacterium heidelbergense TaxID=53376 RepID=A0A1X0DKJ5_MYCHE|nr:AAA family ATPase [Mycobacterium heidelbergense]ORA72908.1 hypothetical protein BST25_13835 [Mycobacterium heidelbergense]BBZ48718.1 hypothetical protein MHEI_04350 [Mycobacterium heidelbergense]
MSNITSMASLALAEDWCPPGAYAGAALARERREVLDWAQARIDELIGLAEAKEHFRMWRTALESDGGAVRENHLVFLGAPGMAKKTFARVIGEVLFGWGMITRPEVTVISAADIATDGPLGSPARRVQQACTRARGGVLFIDEAHQLAPDTDDPSVGVEAIYALLTCMAAYRNELVVILAGYPRPMQDFLTVHAGLAARFPFTMTFTSYTPEDMVDIGRRFAARERLVVHDAAWELLGTEAARLQSIPYGSGTLLDAAGNARYVHEVVGVCQRAWVRRLHRCAPNRRDLRQLVRIDPGVLQVSTADMERAITAAHPAIAVPT